MLEINTKAKPKSCFPSAVLNKYLHVKQMVGSKAICKPPPAGSDEDWLVYFVEEESRQEAIKALEEQGWEADENYPKDKEFVSLKQDGNECNLIMTSSETFFDKFMIAMQICQKFNVMDKSLRIWVHNVVMGNQDWTGEW